MYFLKIVELNLKNLLVLCIGMGKWYITNGM